MEAEGWAGWEEPGRLPDNERGSHRIDPCGRNPHSAVLSGKEAFSPCGHPWCLLGCLRGVEPRPRAWTLLSRRGRGAGAALGPGWLSSCSPKSPMDSHAGKTTVTLTLCTHPGSRPHPSSLRKPHPRRTQHLHEVRTETKAPRGRQPGGSRWPHGVGTVQTSEDEEEVARQSSGSRSSSLTIRHKSGQSWGDGLALRSEGLRP